MKTLMKYAVAAALTGAVALAAVTPSQAATRHVRHHTTTQSTSSGQEDYREGYAYEPAPGMEFPVTRPAVCPYNMGSARADYRGC
jgi:hypothetical protein